METIQNIKDIIYSIRGVQAMIDADLTATYDYPTKTSNQQDKFFIYGNRNM